MVMALIGVVAFLGLGFARTSLDGAAFDLAEIQKQIDEQSALQQQLELEIARLENPARVAPLAEEMGLVIPETTRQLLVDISSSHQLVAEATEEEEQSQ
jgi:cell division protein FtsL